MSKLSILRFGVLLALALMLLAGLVTFGVYLARPHAADGTAELPAKPVMATQIELMVAGMRRMAERIAAHPQTLACFESQASDVCQQQAVNLYLLNQDASVLFVTEGGRGARQLLPGFLPGDTQRLLNASSTGTSSATSATFNLALSHPVVNAAGRQLGYVIIEQSIPQLQMLFDTLPLPDDAAYAELQQVQGNAAPSVLMRRGNQILRQRGKPDLIALQGTPWRIAMWRNDPAQLSRIAPYMLAWLCLSLVIALLVASSLWVLRNRVQDDLRVMVKLTNDLRMQRLRPDYTVNLVEFAAPLNTMLKLGRVMLGKQKEVTTQARVDHLSQVHNRRSFDEKQKELFASLKEGWAHSLLILDIDNFKQVNDTFGHEAGDQLIIKFGLALKSNLRTNDFIARLGGDEFCVLFPFTPLERARELADRLRESMPGSVELIPGVMQKLSWSGGLAEYHQNDTAENEALARADAALLDAKRNGRNVTRISGAVA
jgi:diguanylate cyclase (GGDEF)-like protein